MTHTRRIRELEAKLEELQQLVLTPEQFRSLAEFILCRGELTNAQGMVAQLLLNMAEAAEAAGGE